MKRILVLLATLVGAFSSSAQSIHAGIWQQNDFHYDFVPDTSICSNGLVASPPLPIDLNGDGIDDVVLQHVYQPTSLWGREMTFWITPNSNSEVAFLTTDTCFRTDSAAQIAYVNGFAKTFTYHTIIDGNCTWVDSSIYLSKTRGDVYNYYLCSHATVVNSYTYIGVRIFTPDTLYGWIKMKVVPGSGGYSDDTLRLDDFACQTVLTGIPTVDKNESVTIFPNPSTGNFKCSNYFLSASVEVKDVTGRIVYLREIKNEEPVFDLSSSSNGVYFLSIVSGEKKYVQRLMICK